MAKIKATIDRFEGAQAVLIFAKGQQLILAKSDLPARAKEGQIVYFSLTLDEEATAQKENIAKNILNELICKKNG